MPKETEAERAARKERERAERPRETEEERAARKERERAERERGGERPRETEAERAARKERERAERERGGERPRETEAERAARKERERAERDRPRETEAERAARKERERAERPRETEEERAARKERERLERERGGGDRPRETEEERAARKERERAERAKETDAERAARKERERAERDRPRETEEERAARKERERLERERRDEERSRREVVHKPLPPPAAARAAQPSPQPVKPEPVVQAKNPKAAPVEPDDYDDEDFEDPFEVEQLLEAQRRVAAENAALARKAGVAPPPAAMTQVGGGAAAAAAAAASSSPSAAAGGGGGSQGPVGTSHFALNDLQRQQYRAQFERDLARATALRRLVDLDEVAAVIADIPPMSEYDLYIRNVTGGGGTAATSSAATAAGAAVAAAPARRQTAMQAPMETDLIDAEVQADRVHARAKGSQCPEDLGLFPERFANQLFAVDDKEAGSSAAAATLAAKRPAGIDTAALSSFLSRVFPVVRTLLDESEFGRNVTKHRTKSSFSFSASCTTLVFPPVAHRPVVDLVYSALAPQYVLAVYGPSSAVNTALDRFAGVAVLWNTSDPREPDKVLVSLAPLTAACFSPSRTHLVYGGTSFGTVCAWDLREPEVNHQHNRIKLTSSDAAAAASAPPLVVTPRIPSFSTEWLREHNHTGSRVVSLCVAGYNSILGVRREESEQLVSLDDRGEAHFWVVSEGDAKSGATGGGGGALSPSAGGGGSHHHGGSSAALSAGAGGASSVFGADAAMAKALGGGASAAISDSDHGLNIFSVVRMFHTSTIACSDNNNGGAGGGGVGEKPFDSSSFGAGAAAALSAGGFGGRLVASDLDFSPTDPSHFVVATSTRLRHLSRFGTIAAPSAYYASTSAYLGAPVSAPSALRFSQLDNRIIVAGYQDGMLRLFLKDDAAPQLAVALGTDSVTAVRCSHAAKWVTFALDASGTLFILDHAAEDRETPVAKCALSSAETGRALSIAVPSEEKGEQRIAIGFERGVVQVHTIAEKAMQAAGNRNERWL